MMTAIEWKRALQRLRDEGVVCLVGNSVWGQCEAWEVVALFDSPEEASAYLEASRLPKDWPADARRTDDGMYRSFRPDSVLWDYNASVWLAPANGWGLDPMIQWLTNPSVPTGWAVVRPAPPTGPCPPLPGLRPVVLEQVGPFALMGRRCDPTIDVQPDDQMPSTGFRERTSP